MLKNTNKYQTLLAVCLLTLSACSTNETLTDSPNNQGKTPIELSVGIVGENAATPRALTRTVITTDNPYGHAATAFAANTSLYMVLKSDYDGTGDAQAPLYSRSIGTVPGSGGGNPLNVSFASGYQRYWEDSYSRDSKVSVFSACVPGKNSVLTIGGSDSYNQNDYTWSPTTITPTIDWPLTGVSGTLASQDAAFLTNQDLCFSNNVSGDNCIAFDTSTKKFLAKKMVFHHALTKVTFKIKKGEGFSDTEFNTGFSISLVGFNSTGTLNLATGVFTPTATTTISTLADTKDETLDASYAYVRSCLMLPDTDLNNDAIDQINITINNNDYHIKKSELVTKLNDKKLYNNTTEALDGTKMRHGVHYIFTMTISKSQISNLSAAVVDWETVTAEEVTPSNARISVSLLENGTAETSESPTFDLFRSANVNDVINDNWASYDWATGYDKAYLQKSGSAYAAYEDDGHTTPWYWPNNRTFYHFRTLKPQTTNTWKVETGGTNPNTFEYVTLEGGLFNDTPENSYRDVCWGAPFKSLGSGQKLTYSLTTGFDNTLTGDLTDPANHQISKAIGPTTATINMNTFHMMSDVTINLTTTTGTDAVTLSDATVKLTPVFNTGTVKMGNGLITPGGSTTINGTVSQVGSTSTYQWHYGFVPQSLDGVVLIITTSDNNQYKVTLKDIAASSVGGTNSIINNPYTNNIIDRWYPSFKYTYTFHLTKTGIQSITATLSDWEGVTATSQTVVIQ